MQMVKTSELNFIRIHKSSRVDREMDGRGCCRGVGTAVTRPKGPQSAAAATASLIERAT